MLLLQVSIQRWAFLKDVSFYLVSLLIIAGILADHKVRTAARQHVLINFTLCINILTSRCAGQEIAVD